MSSVCAIVVAYNSKDCIERALASLESACSSASVRAMGPQQTGTIAADGVELLVVDNASNDGTAAFVRGRFPRCRVIEAGENLGFGRACNLAARETRSDYILLLNPDAWLDGGCLERLVAAMEADPKLGWVAPRLHYPDGRRQFVWGPTIGIFGEAVQRLRNRFERQPWVYGALPRALRALGDPGWYSAACGLVRRRAWEAVDGFDPGFFMYFEDADFGLRLRRTGWNLEQVAGARAFHDKHGPSVSSDRLLRYREAQLRYYRKHRPGWENRLLIGKHRRGLAKIADHAARERLDAVLTRAAEATRSRHVDPPMAERRTVSGRSPR